MSLRGGCDCGNILIVWHTTDYSVVPRACQCDYCRAHGACWVSKSGTRFEALIHRPGQHRIVRQGSAGAEFHECRHCGHLVFVAADLGGRLFGALNAPALANKLGFAAARPVAPALLSPQAKRDRWRDNWCSPVEIHQPD